MSLVSLRSTNFPALFIRHRDFHGDVTAIASELDKQDATFLITPGLADPRLVSFQSINYPAHYLRHQNFRILLSREPASPAPADPFLADATFVQVPGLNDAGASSFRSLNFPERFLRHRNFQLFIEPLDSPNLRPDATFKMEAPLAPFEESVQKFGTGPLTTADSLPLSGNASLTVYKTGEFVFSGHAHDSGADNIRYSVGAILLSASGHAFTLGHQGHLEGTIGGFPSPDRNDDFSTSGSSPALREQFDRLRGAKLIGRIGGSDVLVDGLKSMLGQIVEDLVKQLGQAAVSGLVALI